MATSYGEDSGVVRLVQLSAWESPRSTGVEAWASIFTPLWLELRTET